MVKKSGFLNKIVGRFRAGSMRMGDDRTSPSAARGRATELPVNAVPDELNLDSKRRLSQKENAQLTMTRSFRELSTLLRGVQTRMEGQDSKFDSMSANVAKLPAAAEAQVEMLKSLVTQLETQNTMTGKMVETFAELPAVMKGVQKSLEKTAATDERTSNTLNDFKGTMDRIQGSMGDMVKTSQTQAQAASDIAEGHKETVRSLETTTHDSLEALRTAQEDQANRMSKIASETGRSNRVIVVLLILSFAAMVAILATLVNSQ